MNLSTPPPNDPPDEDPWTGPSEWFRYRCRSCNHADWVEDIGALAFGLLGLPTGIPGGLCRAPVSPMWGRFCLE